MSAATKTRQDAIALRTQLEEEEINLRERLAELATERTSLGETIKDARSEAAEEEALAARQGEPFDNGRQAVRQRELGEQAAALNASIKAISAEVAKIPVEIGDLHRKRFDEFASAAGETSEKARAALAELEQAYRTAYDLWEAATAEWDRAMYDLLEKNGMGSRRRDIPKWPLPPPAEIFTSNLPAPRPFGYVDPDERQRIPEPGNYVSSRGQVYSLDSERAIRSHQHLLQLDAHGFTEMRPLTESTPS